MHWFTLGGLALLADRGARRFAALRHATALPGVTVDQPVAIVSPPGDARRIFVVEKPGRILVFDASSPPASATVFLDLSERVGRRQRRTRACGRWPFIPTGRPTASSSSGTLTAHDAGSVPIARFTSHGSRFPREIRIRLSRRPGSRRPTLTPRCGPGRMQSLRTIRSWERGSSSVRPLTRRKYAPSSGRSDCAIPGAWPLIRRRAGCGVPTWARISTRKSTSSSAAATIAGIFVRGIFPSGAATRATRRDRRGGRLVRRRSDDGRHPARQPAKPPIAPVRGGFGAPVTARPSAPTRRHQNRGFIREPFLNQSVTP